MPPADAKQKTKRKAADCRNPDPPKGPADVEILIYDFRGQAQMPDGPVGFAQYDPYHAAAHELIRDVLVFHHKMFRRLSYDGAGGRVVLFLDVTRKGGWSDPFLRYLSFSRETPLPGEDVRRRYRFGDFALAPDYVAHEFQHLVTYNCADLSAPGEPLALNESLSDVFGVAFRHWRETQSDPNAKPEWRFGAGTALAPLSCTRNLDTPGDGAAWNQGVAHMKDSGAAATPYALSSIPSRAFRVASQLLGENILDVAKVWNAAITDKGMNGVRTFSAFADLTLTKAYDVNADVAAAVRGGWAAVGIPIVGSTIT